MSTVSSRLLKTSSWGLYHVPGEVVLVTNCSHRKKNYLQFRCNFSQCNLCLSSPGGHRIFFSKNEAAGAGRVKSSSSCVLSIQAVILAGFVSSRRGLFWSAVNKAACPSDHTPLLLSEGQNERHRLGCVGTSSSASQYPASDPGRCHSLPVRTFFPPRGEVEDARCAQAGWLVSVLSPSRDDPAAVLLLGLLLR